MPQITDPQAQEQKKSTKVHLHAASRVRQALGWRDREDGVAPADILQGRRGLDTIFKIQLGNHIPKTCLKVISVIFR